MAVVLIGPPASGKSRIGRRLAKRLGVPFIDTDAVVSQEHGEIPAIFSDYGEEQFRVWEREAVTAALSHDGVIAFGGGAVLNGDTQADLANHRVVLLDMSAEAAQTRLVPGKRPLITDIDSWQTIYDKRIDLYRSLADGEFVTSFRKGSEVADEIAAWVTTTAPTKAHQ